MQSESVNALVTCSSSGRGTGGRGGGSWSGGTSETSPLVLKPLLPLTAGSIGGSTAKDYY